MCLVKTKGKPENIHYSMSKSYRVLFFTSVHSCNNRVGALLKPIKSQKMAKSIGSLTLHH